MGIIPEVIAALLFVGSTGLLFNQKFRDNRFLVLCAAAIALASTYLLTEHFVRQTVGQMLAEQSSDQSGGSIEPTSSYGEAPPAVTQVGNPNPGGEFDLSVCDAAQAQWTASQTSENAVVLRDFLESVPARCLALRDAVTLRLAQVETSDATRREDEAYQRALQANSRAEYESFLRSFPDSQRHREMRERLSTCRVVNEATGRARTSRIEASTYMGGWSQSDLTRARQECSYNLETDCQRLRGVLGSVRFQTHASFQYWCEAECTVRETRQVELCQ